MSLGPAATYGLFFLAASAAVVLLSLSTYVLGRRVGYERALPATLLLVGGFTAVGAVGGFGAAVARMPVLVGVAFLYVPVGVGGWVARAVTGRGWRAVCRLLLGGWMAALVVSLVSQAAGASFGTLIGWAPGLLGVDWYLGFLVYMVGVGLVTGAFTVGLLAWDDREAASVGARGV
ncbi:hypothetical protein [Candidatus Halobonum tyrrellensis]|uniref:Uncharacterized protein n=1 Tax=Candidatus Halobonum tyrrellensis G22 TaxID=1324957 RepID=V4HJU6_9EURY|nr:hypothetical protein [Candidatus Halobonum tyrrellensis]ESP88189.1 hypothetical protein K933_10275 [Candidatus Halobonum tyrrellensis G22]